MAVSKFTPEIRGALIERTAAGVSLVDACRDLRLRQPTVKTWLAKGRKGEPVFAEFVAAIEQARQAATDRPEPMDADELMRVVSQSARKGSVAAMKLRWEMILADRNADEAPEDKPADPLEALDELAQRRAA